MMMMIMSISEACDNDDDYDDACEFDACDFDLILIRMMMMIDTCDIDDYD